MSIVIRELKGIIAIRNSISNSHELRVGGIDFTFDHPFVASTKAADLDAFNDADYLWAADSASLSITGDISVEAWVRPFSLVPGGKNYLIVAKRDDGTGDGESFHLKFGSDEKLGFAWSDDGTANDMFEESNAAAYAGGDVGTWIHVGVTLDVSAKDCILYKNGSSIASTLVTDNGKTSIFDGGQKFCIGTFLTSGAFFANQGFNGAITKVRIWNDVRTAGEISDSYQGLLTGGEAGLAAYFPLQELEAADTGNFLPLL